MQIIHTPKDGFFETDNLEELKTKIEEHYNYLGYKPKVTISGNYVIVDIDTDLLEKCDKNFQRAQSLCSKNPEEARKMLKDILKVCPAHSESYRLLAQLKMNEGKIEAAIDICIDALRANPKNIWALLLMGNLQSRDKGNLDAGMKYFDKVLEIDPDNMVTLNNIGGLLCQKKKFEEAIPYFDRCIKACPDYANAYLGKSSALQELGRLWEAFDAAHTGALVSKSVPENPGARQHLLAQLLEVAKLLAPTINYQNIIDAWVDIIHKVDSREIRFEKDNKQYLIAHLEHADIYHRNYHLIKYKESSYSPHSIIHEFQHLESFSKDIQAGTMKFISSSQENYRNFLKQVDPFFKKLGGRIDRDKIEKIKKEMFDGLVLLVMNTPLDLFVERNVYSIKEMRPMQLLSLFKMQSEYVQSYQDSSKQGYLPPFVFNTSRVLMMVSALQLKKLYGLDFVHEYKPSKLQYDQAMDLYDEYEAYENSEVKPGEEYDLLDYFCSSLRFHSYLNVMDKMPGTEFQHPEYDFEKDAQEMDDHLTEEEKEKQRTFEEKHGEGRNPMVDMMMTMYMVGALEYFDGMPMDQIRTIAFQIAMLGVGGIDPNKKGYEVLAITNKKFSGYELLAYYYVSWKLAEPEKLKSLGLPFDGPYESAKQIFDSKKGNK